MKNRIFKHNSASAARMLRRRPKPLWFVIPAHIVALGVALCLFALPHHVIPEEHESLGLMSARGTVSVSSAVPLDTQTVAENPSTDEDALPSAEETAEAAVTTPIGYFGDKFADKFITGAPQKTENTYVSENLNIRVDTHIESGVQFYVADIYIRDITNLTRQFAQGRYGRSITEDICELSARVGSVLSINGDYYGTRDNGVVMVNGELFNNEEVYRDIGVLYWDGTFDSFHDKDFDCMAEVEKGAYQIWNFGPALLDENGQPIETYDSIYDGVTERQPRSAFGYYEPGHYCFINVEGRLHRSKGLSFYNMGRLAQTLGLTQLYGMDGGKTAELAFDATLVNKPPDGGRACSDYICILDTPS